MKSITGIVKKYLQHIFVYIVKYPLMKEQIHKYKDDWVIIRFDEKDLNWRKNGRSEYWTGTGWKPGLKNAKLYWREDDAAQALVTLRINRAALFTNKSG